MKNELLKNYIEFIENNMNVIENFTNNLNNQFKLTFDIDYAFVYDIETYNTSYNNINNFIKKLKEYYNENDIDVIECSINVANIVNDKIFMYLYFDHNDYLCVHFNKKYLNDVVNYIDNNCKSLIYMLRQHCDDNESEIMTYSLSNNYDKQTYIKLIFNVFEYTMKNINNINNDITIIINDTLNKCNDILNSINNNKKFDKTQLSFIQKISQI